MKTFLVAAVILAASVTSGADRAKWAAYNSPSGRFSAEFPGKPFEQTQMIRSKKGFSTEAHMTACQASETSGYLVMYFDFTPPQGKRVTLDQVYDALYSGWAGKNYDVRSMRKVTFHGVKGREYELSRGDTSMILRFFLKPGRVYAVGYAWEKNSQRPSGGQHFVDSFRMQ